MVRTNNIRHRKSLGQVFLTTDWPLQRMRDKLKEWRVERILEIGPGAGVFTKLLVREGFAVTAIEKDDRFAELMQTWADDFRDEFPGSLTVINQDVLKFALDEWVGSSDQRTAIVGNIPYNISSPIVMKILPELSKIAGSLIMTQLEFAKRVAANPNNKDYGSLSVYAQLRSEVNVEFDVGRECFKPIPKVDSAVLSIRQRQVAIPQDVLLRAEKVTRAAFNQRRKKLRNSVSQYLTEELEATSPIELERRADTLSPQEYLALAAHLLTD